MKLWGSQHSRTPRIALTTLVLGTFGLFIATPADATTASYTNPTACSASVQSGVCISMISVDYTATTITLSVTVGQATDPTTDPNWHSDNTSIGWDIYVARATTPAYLAEVSDTTASTPTFAGSVGTEGSGSSPVCSSTSTPPAATPSFEVSTNTYQISFAASCIESPSSISVTAQFDYDDNGDALTTSFLPTAPCCSVTPDATTTTASSTTTTTTTSTTTTTVPSSIMGATTTTTTTTTSPAAAVVSSPSSTGNTGSSSSPLAFTGLGDETPVLIVVGAGMIAIGTLGRRRFLVLARRAKRPRVVVDSFLDLRGRCLSFSLYSGLDLSGKQRIHRVSVRRTAGNAEGH